MTNIAMKWLKRQRKFQHFKAEGIICFSSEKSLPRNLYEEDEVTEKLVWVPV